MTALSVTGGEAELREAIVQKLNNVACDCFLQRNGSNTTAMAKRQFVAILPLIHAREASLRAALDAANARCAALEEALRPFEWRKDYPGGSERCPSCGRLRFFGDHKSGCRIAAVLPPAPSDYSASEPGGGEHGRTS